jgi:hypothetical protein
MNARSTFNQSLAQPVATQLPPFAVQRSLLFALGTEAVGVAQRAMTVSRDWLRLEQLPTWFANLDEENACAGLVAGCNALADTRLVQQLQQQGYTIKQRNEINLWLIIDLNPAHGELEHTPEQMATLVEESAQQVRTSLKVQLTPHALLLCEPQDQSLAVQWAQCLKPICEDRIYLCGPVNQQHLRAEAWPLLAAETLAALLWSERSAPGITRWAEGSACWLTAVGATGWRAPTPELQHWLAIQALEQQIVRLEAHSSEVADLGWLRSAENLTLAVTAQVVPVPRIQAQLPRWPRWEQLATLAERLQTLLQDLFARRAPQQRAARSHWLQAELERWDALLTGHVHAQSSAAMGSIADLQTSFAQIKRSLQAATDTLDGRLEAIETDLGEQEVRCLHAYNVLQEICRQFPRVSLLGILTALTMPWRWWRWVAHYLFMLPECSQQLLNAQCCKAELLWAQENALTIRQCLLAMGQSVRQQEIWLNTIQDRLAAVKRSVSGQKATIADGVLCPWSAARLQWLAQQMATSVEDGPTLSLDLLCQLDVDAIFPTLWQKILTCTTPLLDWSPAALIEGALPERWQRRQWLQQMCDAATPLWPSEELLPDTECVDWLLLPSGEESVMVGDLPVPIRQGYCHFNGLLIVREVAVNLGLA